MSHQGVHDLFSHAAARFADQMAIDRVSQRITYGELETQSNRLAQALRRRGLTPGGVVAIVAADPIAVTTALLGVLKAGGVFVPLDPTFPVARLQTLVAQVTPLWYVVDAASAARLPSLADPAGRVLRLDALADEAPERPAVAWHADDPCSIYFTSGSTGRPKAILGRVSGLDHFVRWAITMLGVGPGTRVSQLASPSFDGFLKDVFVPLCAGGMVCPPETRQVVLEPARLADWLDVEGIEILQCVPSVLRALLNERVDPAYFSALRWIVLAGEAVLPADVARWRAIFGDRVGLLNLYGPTETTITKFAYVIQPGDEDRPSIPIGKPIPGAAAMVFTTTGEPCRIGGVGEIYIRTPYRALGYYGDPDLTRQAFVPNPFGADPDDLIYRTGDYGRLLEDGTFEYLGRRDQQVKVRGVRVELGEIENALRRHPAVQDVAVVDRTDASGLTALCAYVVLAEGTGPGALREYLATQLPEFLVPSAFVALAALPRTLNGKVDRHALPPLEATRAAEAARPARTAVEEIVAGIWSEVLRLPQVGLTDHFFELGGHSLLATQILSRVREALGVDLPLRTLFEAPTLDAFVAQVAQARATGGAATLAPIRPVPRGDALPLSYAQQRLWLLEQLATDDSAYHLPLAARLIGRLNVGLLEQTFSEVIRRHEVLRTRFSAPDGEPRQVIGPRVEQRLPLVDLRGLTAPTREREARRVAEADVRRRFDLAAGPLVRTVLMQHDEETHTVLCTMHHIVTDAWSRGVFTRELSDISQRFAHGDPSRLAELTIQYADYAASQRDRLAGGALEAQLDDWTRQLAHARPVLDLPLDRPRPPVQTSRGAREVIKLTASASHALKDLSRRAGVTVFMTLLAAFKTLLYRWTGQEDIVVGTSVAGRTRADVESLIGFFVNMLALRTDLSRDPSFQDLLRRVRDVTLQAFAHQDVPFEMLVDKVQPERNLSHSPVFQVVFSFQNAPVPDLMLPEVAVSVAGTDETLAKYDLLMDMWESEDGIAGTLEYNTDLFDRATAKRLITHFDALLTAIVSNPEGRLSELPLMPESERRQALDRSNGPDAEYPRATCVHELFESQVARTPEAPAVICDGRQLSYRELNRQADQVAHYLRGLGVAAGSIVAICLEHSAEELAALLGVLKAGAAYLPLDPETPVRRMAFTLADAKASVVMTQSHLATIFQDCGKPVICLDAAWTDISACSALNPTPLITSDAVAYVIYTSGSTGRPKGVAVSHRALVNYVWWAQHAYIRNEALASPLYSSLAFDLTITSIYPALVTGNPVVVYAAPDGVPPLRDIVSDRRPGLLKVTPAHLSLVKQWDNRASGIRRLIVGGEALSAELAREVYESFGRAVEIYNEYGPTEATVGCMIHAFDPASDRAMVPIGRPAANGQIHVLDRWLNHVPEGVVGEIYIAGDGLAHGYLDRSEMTARRFVPNPFAAGRRMYKTGDLARWLPGGVLDFVGRVDDQIKLRGFRIEMGDIEAILVQHDAIRDAAVVVREDAPGEQRLVAYIVSDRDASAHDIRQFLQDRLPRYMIPAAFVVLPALPLTSNGKVDRRALPRPDVHPESAYVAPQSELEEAIEAIWRQVLRVDRVGIYDDFFHIGGQSLLAFQVIQRINQTFEIDLPLRAAFSEPTIAGQAILVEEVLIERLDATPDPAVAARIAR